MEAGGTQTAHRLPPLHLAAKLAAQGGTCGLSWKTDRETLAEDRSEKRATGSPLSEHTHTQIVSYHHTHILGKTVTIKGLRIKTSDQKVLKEIYIFYVAVITGFALQIPTTACYDIPFSNINNEFLS